MTGRHAVHATRYRRGAWPRVTEIRHRHFAQHVIGSTPLVNRMLEALSTSGSAFAAAAFSTRAFGCIQFLTRFGGELPLGCGGHAGSSGQAGWRSARRPDGREIVRWMHRDRPHPKFADCVALGSWAQSSGRLPSAVADT